VVCFRYIVVNTVHRGNNRDDDDGDNNNNDNNILSYNLYSEIHIKALLNSSLISAKGLFSFSGSSLTVASNVFVKLGKLVLFQIRRRHLYISNRLITGIKSYQTSYNDERVSR